MVDQQRIIALIEGFLDDRLSTMEVLELQEALLHADGLNNAQRAFQQILSSYPSSTVTVIDRIDEDLLMNKILQAAPVKTIEQESIVTRPVHRIHFLKTAWFRYAAAVILIITGIMLYYNLSPYPPTQYHYSPNCATCRYPVMPCQDITALCLRSLMEKKSNSTVLPLKQLKTEPYPLKIIMVG